MRFLTEDGIDNDDYNEVKSDLEAKIANCEKELKDCSRDLSNLVEYTDVALKIASTLGSTWDKMDFKVCQKIQNLAFPKGIKWDGEKRCYRTDGMNEFFRQIGLLRGSARGEGIKETDTDCSVSGVSRTANQLIEHIHQKFCQGCRVRTKDENANLNISNILVNQKYLFIFAMLCE